MPDTTAPDNVLQIPVVSLVPPAVNVTVSPAQVWSAVVQNTAIALCLTWAYMAGKCPQEYWLLALSYLGGIDLLGRRLALKSQAVATAIGSTGGIVNAGRALLTGLTLSILGSALASGCGASAELLPRTGAAILQVQAGQAKVIEARHVAEHIVDLLCMPSDAPSPSELCTELTRDLAQAHEATDSAADVIDAAAAVYRELNEAAK